MNPSTIFTIVRKELIDHLRDRRTALMVLTLSIAMGPLMLIGMSYFISSIEEKAEKKEIFVLGLERAPQLANFLARQDMTVKSPPPDYRELIKQGKHDPVLVVPADFKDRFLTGEAKLELVYDDTRADGSRASIAMVRRVLQGFNSEVSAARLAVRGVSPKVLKAIEVRDINLGTPAQRAAMILFMIPWMALLMAIAGCVAIAIDITAGERERGSLEPLLMNPVGRGALVLGKWMAVGMYGMGIVTLILLGFALTLALVPLPELVTVVSLSPAQHLGFAAMLFPFAPAIGALQMLIATFGRTFKESQTYVNYLVTLFSILPALTVFAQVQDAAWQLFVPMMGQLMVLTRILRGEPVEAMHFLIPLAICVLIVVASLAALTRLLTHEKIIFARS